MITQDRLQTQQQKMRRKQNAKRRKVNESNHVDLSSGSSGDQHQKRKQKFEDESSEDEAEEGGKDEHSHHSTLEGKRTIEETVQDERDYIFRILLPFLSNLFGGPFNPLEMLSMQIEPQGPGTLQGTLSQIIPIITVTTVTPGISESGQQRSYKYPLPSLCYFHALKIITK